MGEANTGSCSFQFEDLQELSLQEPGAGSVVIFPDLMRGCEKLNADISTAEQDLEALSERLNVANGEKAAALDRVKELEKQVLEARAELSRAREQTSTFHSGLAKLLQGLNFWGGNAQGNTQPTGRKDSAADPRNEIAPGPSEDAGVAVRRSSVTQVTSVNTSALKRKAAEDQSPDLRPRTAVMV